MARPSIKANLTELELSELQTIVRSTMAESRIKERALIILDWHEGRSYDETQHLRRVSRSVVAKWRIRFFEFRIDGLGDAARSGKPIVITEEQKNKVIHLACAKPGKGYTNWSQHRIGKQIGISQSKVNKILQGHDFKPHNVSCWCGKSTEPEFESKMLNIVGLYMNPPQNAIVLCIDEKNQEQALDRTQPELPLRRRNPKRLTTTYKRNGVLNLIASLAVQHRELIPETMESNNAVNFLKFLKKLKKLYSGKKLHIIADNRSLHKHASVKQWIAKNKLVELHHTPIYSSWLNQVEIWFNILSKDVLKGAVWHSKQHLVEQLMEYIRMYNKERAKPFTWTYNPN